MLESNPDAIALAHSVAPRDSFVADAAALLTALSGEDRRDAATRTAGSHATDYTRALDADGLRGLRLGLARKRYTGNHRAVDALFTVPMGSVMDLPVRLSFFGRAWSETLLIEAAYGYEQASRLRRPPRFPATVEG